MTDPSDNTDNEEATRPWIEFTLVGRVSDLDALYQAALVRAVADGMTQEAAVEALTEEDDEFEGEGAAPRIPCVTACVVMLLDPSAIDGFEIDESYAEAR